MKFLVKLYLENNGHFVLGPGRVRLLRSEDKLGSLQKAAREVGMSYRWAWGRLKNMEKALGVPMLTTGEGSTRSKGKVLTKEAKELLAWIASIEEKMEAVLKESIEHCPGFLENLKMSSSSPDKRELSPD